MVAAGDCSDDHFGQGEDGAPHEELCRRIVLEMKHWVDLIKKVI